METYNVIAVAKTVFKSKNPKFNGKHRVVIESGLSYEGAEEKLLEIYNELFEEKRGWAMDLNDAYEQSMEYDDGISFGLDSINYKDRIYYIDPVDNSDPINYAIVGRTNGYIAQRDSMFNGKAEIIIKDKLTFEDAESILMEMYNNYYADKFGYFWTMLDARMVNGINSYIDSNLNGFEYDSRKFSIELIEE